MGHKKWLDEYPALKQVVEKQPFTVPAGYFSELENKITSTIRLEELKSERGFIVPENYFNDLNGKIQSRINIEHFANNAAGGHVTPDNYFDELSSNIESRIAITDFETGKGLTVPDNYFDELNANIQSRISIEEFTNNETAGHAVPAAYFANLQEQINSRIFVEESLNREEEFTVPAGYFESLNKAILDKTAKQQKEERRGIVRKMFAYNAFKYAAAACLALVVGTGILISQITNSPATAHEKTYLHKQLSTISTGDIQTYLQDEVDPGETQKIVIDENTPVNDANLNSALQSIATNN
jgi:hypothetical protein